jgi:hypothetical protein
MPAVIHDHPYLLSPITLYGIHPDVARRLVLPPTCMQRAVKNCYMNGKLSLPGEYNIQNMALFVNCYHSPLYAAFPGEPAYS